ncbi:uncharacterized protein LOC126669181 isoform X1 [Mercurialis annua]|uniref:uncharacterized protein LOC126669181 isoform X1 n=1 Tax=Mercurialis annua TaxID=3986 RepID=UPI00215F62D5|nr:uncharacterized protein LOC126669181 isoform X1 [Mercurialis annua]
MISMYFLKALFLSLTWLLLVQVAPRSGFHPDNLKHFKRKKNGKKNIVEVRSTKKIYCHRFAARPKNQNSQSTHSYSGSRTSKEKRTKEKSGEVKSTGAAHAIEEDLVDDAIVSEKQREQEHLEKDTEEQEETEHLDENIEVQPNEETSSGKEPKEKRTRGPTTLSKVHSRRMEERKPIVLNVHFQPVGPDDSTLNEFSSFLGTIARNSGLAPLNYESWRKVPYKKELWKYVKKRYIVPEEGKRWVLKTIGDNWRVYKCRLKKNHFYKFKTDKSRLASRPSQVPETQFKALINYWNTDFVKRISEINVENRNQQKDMHTAGPKSFARIRKQLQDEKEDKADPTLAEMFIATRKRKAGRSYKESREDTTSKISKLQELLNSGNDSFSTVIGERPPGRAFLYGRGVTRTNLKNGVGCSSSIIVPEELVQSITDKIRKELKDQFDKEMAGYKALLESVMSQVNPTVDEPSENSDSESAQF